jgi:hypothetical protein
MAAATVAIALSAGASPALAVTHTIGNANVSMGIDADAGLTITSIRDQVTGHEYLTQPVFLFEGAWNNGVPFQSNNGFVVDDASFPSDGESARVLGHATGAPLSLDITFTAAPSDTAIVIRTKVTNTGTSTQMQRFVYPKLQHFATPGLPSNMTGAVPQEIGSVANLNDVNALGMGLNLGLGLPTAINVMQVADVYDASGGGGLFFADLDGDSDRGVAPLNFVASKTEIDGFWTGWLKPGARVGLPRLAIGVHHSGDWHQAVDYYVKAHQDKWTAADTPSWLRDAGAIYSPTAGGSGGIYLYQQPQATLPSRITDFDQLPNLLHEAESLGTNVLYLNDYWEGVANPQGFPPYYNKGDYTPRTDLGGATALTSGIAAVHAEGGKVIAYIEPYIIYEYSQIAAQKGLAWAGRNAAGDLDQSYRYYYTMLFPFTPWQDQVIAIARRLVGEYGFDGVFLDSSGWQMNKRLQTDSERVMYTSSQWTEGVLRLADRVRAAVRALKPDAVVMAETTSGPTARHIDGGVTADFAWLIGQNGGRIVGSPVRYGLAPVNVFSNGRICAQATTCDDQGTGPYAITNAEHLNQLNQVYAAGHSLALSQLELPNAAYVKQLVEARKTYKDALVRGRQTYQPATGDAAVPAYFYEGTTNQVVTAANTTTSTYSGTLTLRPAESGTTWKDVLTNETFTASGTSLALDVPAGGLRILVRQGTVPAGPPPVTLPATTYTATLLDADFDDGDLLNWWTVRDGSWSNPGSYVEASTTTGGTLMYDRRTGNDFTYSGDLTLTSGGEAGLSFRLSDDGAQGYDVILSRYDGGVKLAKRPYQVLGSQSMAINLNQRYHVTVVASGGSIEVSVDGVPRINVTDTSYASGRFGLTNFQSTARFDDLVAAEPGVNHLAGA